LRNGEFSENWWNESRTLLGAVNEIMPVSFDILHPSSIKVSTGGVHKSYRVVVIFMQIGAVTAVLCDGALFNFYPHSLHLR